MTGYVKYKNYVNIVRQVDWTSLPKHDNLEALEATWNHCIFLKQKPDTGSLAHTLLRENIWD